MRTKHPVIAQIKYLTPSNLTAGYLAKFGDFGPEWVGAYIEGRTADDRPVFLRLRGMFDKSAGIAGDIAAMRKLAERLTQVADTWEKGRRDFGNPAACDTITKASQ